MAPGFARRHAGFEDYGVVVVVGACGEPPAWSCRRVSCGAALEPAAEHAHAWTLTLPFTIRFASVFRSGLPCGPAAFVTWSVIEPPATVPLRLIGRHLHFAWSPDFPGPLEVEVPVDVCGPGPFAGGGAAIANDATTPAAMRATSAMTCFFM